MTNDTQKKQPTPEEIDENFRMTLEDVVEVAGALAAHCGGNTEDLVEVCKLALDNAAHRRFLLSVVVARRAKK